MTQHRIPYLSNIHVKPSQDCCDHDAVLCNLSLHKLPHKPSDVKSRKWTGVDPVVLATTISSGISDSMDRADVSSDVNLYNNVLIEAADKVAPLRLRKAKSRVGKAWYNDDIHKLRVTRRQLERKWIKSGLTVDNQIYQEHSAEVVKVIDESKHVYYRSKLISASPRDMFKLVGTLTSSKQKVLPICDSDIALANKIALFFSNKIRKIRDILDNMKVDEPTIPSPQISCLFSSFEPVSSATVRKVIQRSPTKSSSLDQIPTSVLKISEVLDVILPVITNIINSSLLQGCVPLSLKSAAVTPLIKKQNLDRNELKNYRPISQLSFISKTLERIVSAQLLDHMSLNLLHEPLQSAYKPGHSTETAILRVKNDIDCALGERKGVLLVLLDLSAAFDTVDHTILLKRMNTYLGISGVAHEWFKSYLSGRTQSVVINESHSEPVDITVGVPQGSVLGPQLFSIYLLPLGQILRRHGVHFHIYADDTQIYVVFDPQDIESFWRALRILEECIKEIRAWMAFNKLMFNDGKSEFEIIVSRHFQTKFRDLNPSLHVGSAPIFPSKVVRDLGVLLDAEMTLSNHVGNIIRSMYFQMRQIGRIRHHLDEATCTKIVMALVTSRLDFSNSALYGIADHLLTKLQLAHNNAARLITKTKRHDHITPVMKSLHWLPVKFRSIFKNICMVHSVLYSKTCPSYLQELVVLHAPQRTLRSGTDGSLLTVPSTHRCLAAGDRAFSVCGPRLWNNLPMSLRATQSAETFKKKLKTTFLIYTLQSNFSAHRNVNNFALYKYIFIIIIYYYHFTRHFASAS